MTLKYSSKKMQEFLQEGRAAETLVADVLETVCGGSCTKSTMQEDKFKHIDLWWDSPKMGKLSIDVKGRKKNKRTDTHYSDINWIEAVGIAGHKGWIYGEQAYVAFLTEDKILFVKPQRLIDVYEEKVKGKELVFDTPKDCYVPYQRAKWGRKDVAFKMPNKDIEALAHFIVELPTEKSEE